MDFPFSSWWRLQVFTDSKPELGHLQQNHKYDSGLAEAVEVDF